MKIRNRIKELRHVKANELHPNSKNWRTHPKAQQDALKGILAEIGYADALLAREQADGSLVLVDGHLRAETTPEEEVPVLILDIDEAESDKLLLSLDPLAALAETNATALDSLLREVDTGSEGLQEMYADMADAADLYKDDTKEVEEDEVPEPPADPITQPGDLWTLGNHRLLCGDSTKKEDVDRLMSGAKADMMFTDPPYGVDYSGGIQFDAKGKTKTNNREKLANDNSTAIYFDFLPVVIPAVDGPCYMWFAGSKARDVYNATFEIGCEIHALIIWHKTNATYAAMNAQYKQRHEPCLYFKPKGSTLRWCGASTEATVWSQDRDAINDLHPTQKPIKLAAKAIGNHDAQTVLDVFLGSGSTLIAAEQLSRTCYGMELSPQYCDVIVQRWETLTGKKAERQEANGETRPTP